jgi:AcrR family transcriptional regulator
VWAVGVRRARGTAAGTRERIVAAAAEVMGSLGLARATTKEIARAAGYSESTLYKHFGDKTELLVAVLSERMPPFIEVLKALPDQAGQGDVADRLRDLAGQGLRFYEQSFALVAALFAEPALLERHRRNLAARGAGPHRANELLAAYLRAERDLGRVRAELDPPAAAAMLLGACFQRAFFAAFAGEALTAAERGRFAAALVATLLAPGPG